MNAVRLPKYRAIFAFFLVVTIMSVPLVAQKLSATYTKHSLALEIPYNADHAGAGRLTVEILSPEDEVLGHSERTVSVVKGANLWRQEVAANSTILYDELVWQRVRSRFHYDGEAMPAMEETASVASILRRPIMKVLGQISYLAGAQAAIRIIVSDENGGEPRPIPGNSTLRIELAAKHEKPTLLFTGKFDHHGTTEAVFRFPTGRNGNLSLRVTAETPIGAVETTQTIRLEDKAGILLTTEKLIYQPAQTIHARALVLDHANHHAIADRKLTFELEDSRGNKVFRRATQTDAFGVTSVEFALAEEVNLGAYHLRALMGEDVDNPTDTQEVALQVQRYVLPKFRVAIDLAQKDGRPKRNYRPGEHITGTVRANYFFGKAVENASIDITVQAMDVSLFTAAHADGRTDSNGDYRFDVTLPDYLSGRKQNQGGAPVLIEASVKDSAGHSEKKDEPITVSQSSLLLTAVSEGGSLVSGIENQVFVLASYPDGTPAQAAIKASVDNGPTQHTETDQGGIAIVRITPSRNGETKLHLDAKDSRGNHASDIVNLQSRLGDEQVLLRVVRAVYKPGDLLKLAVLTTRQSGTVYIDLVKDGQTIQTRDVDIVNGRAELSLRTTTQMAGTLSVNAYLFGRDAQPIEDHRMVFVQPADDLHIQTTADAASYLPGSEAHVHFHITNARGEGVQAALGLEVVDEAVFALAEKQPGFAKVFFYLEQELLKPRFEIHSLSMSDAITSTDLSQEEAHDRAARVLFSATQSVSAHTLQTEAGRALPTEYAVGYRERYRIAYVNHVRALLMQITPENGKDRDFIRRFAALKEEDGQQPSDAWCTPLRVDPMGQRVHRGNSQVNLYRVHSAGPDRQFGTEDDLTVMVDGGAADVFPSAATGTMQLRLEHDRGPMTDSTEVAGMITDATGAVIPGATAHLRRLDVPGVRNSTSGRDGTFALTALPVGRYRLEISSPGFQSSMIEFTMKARDRAVITCVLQVGSSTQTVEVTAAAPLLMTESASVQSLPLNNRAAAGVMLAKASPGMSVARQASSSAEGNEAHVRSYFPEALYINPEVLTDGHGNASISIPVADSITTWRMDLFASTKAGALGSSTSSLKVFQDFFVDLDLPVTLTQGDRVTIPVAVYNYTAKRSDVTLTLQHEDWFELVDDASEKTVSVDASKVGESQFTLQVKRLGKFKLTLSAHLHGESDRQDTVVREIEVVPNGQQQEIVFNGRLESSVQHIARFPRNAIPDASKLFVRLYPGPLSQVIEGMDGILRMPGGCFEQTSSSTYPNVLALDYMKRTKKLTPEVHAKAEGYIANGYQRLLTFEVPGGGFSWFGQAPANKILTAYGLMEFRDMSHVYDVDPRLIERTEEWLAAQQQPDGSWKPDTQFINEGATNRYNSDVLRITAYLAWALEGDDSEHQAVEKAKAYIASHLDRATSSTIDSYTLAVLANLAVDGEKNPELTRRILQMLLDARTEKGDQAWWSSAETSIYATGESAAVETTGLAVQALLKSGQYPEPARRALTWLLSKKSASGNWGTTQATIMALRALLLASEASAGDAAGSVQISLNGKVVQTLTLNAQNNDLLHQFVLPKLASDAEDIVELRFTGSGSMAYQVAGRYFTPWTQKTEAPALSIDVSYDRTKLAQNDRVTSTAIVHSNLEKTANMVMVDLGIPPGFDLQSEDLQEIVEKTAQSHTGRLEKFSLTATQAILYFNSIGAGETIRIKFRLRAKYPIRAKNFASNVYEYYDPKVRGTATPIELEILTK